MSFVSLNPKKKKVPAAPPTVVLRMRLVSTAGQPFADRDYELEWGKKKIQGKTDADGLLEQKLDAKIQRGVLDLGEIGADGRFVARITIPVQIASPPPPFAASSPGDGQGKKGGEEKKSPPPRPAPPSRDLRPPNSDASPQMRREYEENQQEWRDWEEDMERWEERQKKGFPEEETKPDFDPAGRGAASKPDQGRPALTPKEKKELEDRLNAQRRRRHEHDARMFEIAWRLSNLGWLTWPFQPEFPLSGSFATDTLLDALRRYSQKNGLPIVEEADVLPSGDMLDRHWAHIVDAHDDKKP